MNPVVHFEMPFEDRQRMADFYSKAFGWKAQMFGPEMGNYVTVATGESDPKTQRPTQPGTINGGFFQKSAENSAPSVVIGVQDIRQAMKKVTDAGGKLVGLEPSGGPIEIPGVGLYATFVDTEGNRVSLLQPMGM